MRRSGGADASRGVDYAKEGRELLERVNLKLDGAPARYADWNPIYRSPETNATLFVGNARCATSASMLAEINVKRIVFCQARGEGEMAFRSDPAFKYLEYPIGHWRSTLTMSPKPIQTQAYFEPLFTFVENELAAGNNVLIHCLAGAHRAGTAGVACLMHLCDLEPSQAITIAQTARPAINPIGDFPKLLRALDTARRVGGEASVAGGAAEQPEVESGGFGGYGASAAAKVTGREFR
jgi:hypothetical protein